MNAISIISGRPNIIKSESVHLGLTQNGYSHEIVDVGVYNKPYGAETYKNLNLPNPKVILDDVQIGDSYLESLSFFSDKFMGVFKKIKPDVIIAYGDLDPSVGAAFAALQLGIPIIHVEAGLRNYDFYDTEEINRVVLDHFAIQLHATSENAKSNLLKEKIDKEKIFLTGNTIIDVLKRHLPDANENIISEIGLESKGYGLVTIHRLENLNSFDRLYGILKSIEEIQKTIPVLLIQYSSTELAFRKHNLYTMLSNFANLKTVKTFSYHDYLGILKNALFVLTDSSGIQDETTYLNIPCLTCRNSTHRTETLTIGSNQLVGTNSSEITDAVHKIIHNKPNKERSYPPEWDFDFRQNIAKSMKGLLWGK